MELTAPPRRGSTDTLDQSHGERWPVSRPHHPSNDSAPHLPVLYVPPPPPPVVRRKWKAPRRCVAIPFESIDPHHCSFPTRVLVPAFAGVQRRMLAEALDCLRSLGWATLLYTHPGSGDGRFWEARYGLYDEVWDDWELFADATRGSRGVNINAGLNRYRYRPRTAVVIDAFDATDHRVRRSINTLMRSDVPDLVIAIHRGAAPLEGLDYSLFDSVVTSRSAAWMTVRSGLFSTRRVLSQDRLDLMGRLSFDVPINANSNETVLFRAQGTRRPPPTWQNGGRARG